MAIFADYLSRRKWPQQDCHQHDFLSGYDQDLSLSEMTRAQKKTRLDPDSDEIETAREKVLLRYGKKTEERSKVIKHYPGSVPTLDRKGKGRARR